MVNQIPTEKMVEKAFSTSPDTVYGILIGALVIVIIAITMALRYVYKENQKTNSEYRERIIDITEKMTGVIETNTASFVSHAKSIDRITDIMNRVKI
jgi:sensor domain CHASE-containing protein